MRLLFIDACPRDRETSRTYELCQAFLHELQLIRKDIEVQTVCLREEKELLPFDRDRVTLREQLINEGKWQDPMFRWAKDFANADYLLIGAPYWDLSFPAILKTYIENIFVREKTFRYTKEGEPVGLAKGKKAVYITTAGSPIGKEDWGAGYMKAVLHMLGIHAFRRVSAEGIDIKGWDQAGILAQARTDSKLAAKWLGNA